MAAVMSFDMVFAGFGLLFVVIGIWIVVSPGIHRHRLRTWTPATATVRELETRVAPDSDGDRGSRLVAHYVYLAPDGAEHSGSGSVRRMRLPLDGTPVTLAVIVDPRDPGRSRVADAGTAPLGCAVVFGLVFAGAGLAFTLIGLGIVS